jgi:L-amino acid N-acyltransferase YncA
MTAVVANTTELGGQRPSLQQATIRDAVEPDLPAIVQIYNAAILTRISTAQLETVSVEQRLPWFREHSTESYPLWVAEIDGRVAGWLSFIRS